MRSPIIATLLGALVCRNLPFVKADWPQDNHGGHGGHGEPCETIESDVVIIGGGSSGTYSATRLQEMGKKITLIEKENRLGGHANTYDVPGTNKTFNYGVVVFENTSIVLDYFAHYNVALVQAGAVAVGGQTVNDYVDFANGVVIPPAALAAGSGNITAAFLGYLAQLAKYPYLDNGFNLPSPVPDDLLLPWGEWLAKYNLGAIAFELSLYDQGVGNILDLPTLYVLKYSNDVLIQNLLTGGFVTTVDDNTQELYDHALVQFGSNALLSSNVTHVNRYGDSVEVFVTTPEGEKIVKASKLIMAIEPKLSMLNFLDLDSNERDIFGQFNNSYYWNAVIKDSGIPTNTSVTNVDPTALYGIPKMPGLYGIEATGYPGLHTLYYSSPYSISDDVVKADILATVATVVKSLGLPAPSSAPQLVGFNGHNPFELQVSADAIKNGFYTKLEALQGQKNTWWTGAAWQAQDSSQIWSYTEDVTLPGVIASL